MNPMKVHTVEMNFDYQVKEILKTFKRYYFNKEPKHVRDQGLSHYLDDMTAEIGCLFLESAEQWGNLDKAIKELEDED